MPSVRIKFFANLREITGKSEIKIAIQDKTPFQEILNQLFEMYPRLKQSIMEDTKIREHYRFFLDGLQVDHSKMETLEVIPESTIVILPPAGGG